MFKRFLFAFFVFLFAAFVVAAQERNESAPAAILLDEFGDVVPSSFIARLDNLVVQQQNAPNAKGFIIVYRTQAEPPGKNVRILAGCKLYLTRNRRVDANDFAFVDGGVAGVSVTQLWIVPPGTTPKARTDAYPKIIEDKRLTRKYDEFYYSLGEDESYGFYNSSSLETFAAKVKSEPNATAYIIVYPQYFVDEYEVEDSRGRKKLQRNVYRDALEIARRMSREVTSDLTVKFNLPRNRIRVVNGGYRRLREVELWILPHGEHPPVATPNAFLPRRSKILSQKRAKK